MKEKNKYTLITGASSGIGYESAKLFASKGKNLIIVARTKNNLIELKTEILIMCGIIRIRENWWAKFKLKSVSIN